jgi:hypothetical protein
VAPSSSAPFSSEEPAIPPIFELVMMSHVVFLGVAPAYAASADASSIGPIAMDLPTPHMTTYLFVLFLALVFGSFIRP